MAKAVPGSRIVGSDTVSVSDIEYSSKAIRVGSAFVAISGFKQDGNAYAEEAIGRGAAAIVTEKETVRSVPQLIVPDARIALADLSTCFYPYGTPPLTACGVTGTNGKTTSCFLIKRFLETSREKVGLISSLVYDTGDEKIGAPRTTPESLDVFRLLYAMKENHCSAAVLEISSHALVLHRVRNVSLNVALFTNLTRDHLDFHSSMEDYLEAKARLLDMVAGKNKWAVINYDSPEFRSLLPRVKGSSLTYSLENREADIFMLSYRLRPDGSRFEIHTPAGERWVDFRLVGRFNLYNALGATGAALAMGVDIDAIARGLEEATVVPGRLERIESSAPFSVFIDFAHTPDALTRTIETLRETGQGRVLTLFGCGGDRDRGKRPLMAQTVTSLADYTVLTADNHRTENPSQIFADAKVGFVSGAKTSVVEDRRQAIAQILRQACPGDVVLIAGKGDENYQEINGVKYPWSDRDVSREELQKLGF